MDLLILVIFFFVFEDIEGKNFRRFGYLLLAGSGLQLLISIVERVKDQADVCFIPIVPVVCVDELAKVITHHILTLCSGKHLLKVQV